MTLSARAKGGVMLPTWCNRDAVAQIVAKAGEQKAG
jgi:hypothetical protein